MAYHTYEFLKKRKKDPKWRDAYLEAKWKRIATFLVTLAALIWIFGTISYMDQHNLSIEEFVSLGLDKVRSVLDK